MNGMVDLNDTRQLPDLLAGTETGDSQVFVTISTHFSGLVQNLSIWWCLQTFHLILQGLGSAETTSNAAGMDRCFIIHKNYFKTTLTGRSVFQCNLWAKLWLSPLPLIWQLLKCLPWKPQLSQNITRANSLLSITSRKHELSKQLTRKPEHFSWK